jgi:hypothetical protein
MCGHGISKTKATTCYRAIAPCSPEYGDGDIVMTDGKSFSQSEEQEEDIR